MPPASIEPCRQSDDFENRTSARERIYPPGAEYARGERTNLREPEFTQVGTPAASPSEGNDENLQEVTMKKSNNARSRDGDGHIKLRADQPSNAGLGSTVNEHGWDGADDGPCRLSSLHRRDKPRLITRWLTLATRQAQSSTFRASARGTSRSPAITSTATNRPTAPNCAGPTHRPYLRPPSICGSTRARNMPAERDARP